MRSRLEPMPRVERILREQRTLILNWFTAGGTSSVAIMKAFNGKAA